MKRKPEVVKQAQLAVLEVCSGKETLRTSGVSTCICLLAKGQYGAHSFIAMYHWEGFSESLDKQAVNASEQAIAEITTVLAQYALGIKRSFSRASREEKPVLESMHIIGGERGTPYLSGTELEVETLRQCLPELCEEYFQITPETRYDYKTYLTDSYACHSNTVIFKPSGVKIISDDLDEEDDTTSEDISDFFPEKSEERLPRRRRIR
ncbi:MAG: hypothetical protein NTU48_08060 [Legionellales bacterium]|nr:hypothetical protein [Legionellales bacterium]